MKRRFSIFAALFLVAFSMSVPTITSQAANVSDGCKITNYAAAYTQPGYAGPYVASGSSYGLFYAGEIINLSIIYPTSHAALLVNGTIVGQGNGPALFYYVIPADGTYTISYNYFEPTIGHYYTLKCPGTLPPPPGVTFFNPADGRVDGKPGDRIAVWCNTTATPPTVVVYGVGDASNGSHGFWLGTFDNADLLKAGKTGITKNAGAGNGSVSAMQDGNGNFWVSWNGGTFGATGNPPFAKSFACQF